MLVRGWLFFGLLSSALSLLAPGALAQSAARLIDPLEFGLDLPAGLVQAGRGERVTTEDDDAQPVVGRVHVRIGDGAAVLLPDGRIVARKPGRFAPTDRPFVPLNKEKMAERLKTEFPNFKTKSTNHYVYIYNTSEEFQLGTSRILETMLPGIKAYAEGCKIDTHEPEFPLSVVMFKNQRQFQRYCRPPEGVVAYYDALSNRVYLYEQSRLSAVQPELAFGQAVATIAHEGVHQIMHNIGAQQRLSVWPMWLAEGLAEFFAPTTMTARLHWAGVGQVNNLRMYELEQYLKSKEASEPTGQIVEHTVLAGRLTSTGYAAAWALTYYLAKSQRAEFGELLLASSKLPPLSGALDQTAAGAVRSNRDQFVNQFGNDFKEHERKLVLYLKKLPYSDPFKDAPHFVALVVKGEGKKTKRSANTFRSLPQAQKWIDDTVAKKKAGKATLRSIMAFPNRPQAEAYAEEWLKAQ